MPDPLDELQRILIVKMSSIGDVVHSLPLLDALKQRSPSAFIGWVVDRRCKDVLESNPHIDRLFIFERAKWGGRKKAVNTTFEFAGLVRSIRKHRFQLALDPQGLFRSGLITYLSGARIRMGFSNARELGTLFYNVKVDVPEGVKLHAVDRYMLMGRKLGIETSRREFTIDTPRQTMERVDSLLAANGIQPYHRLVLVNPWARWESKRWPLEKFTLLADMLNCEADIRMVIVGGRLDLQGFVSMTSSMRTKAVSLVGMTSLTELAYLMKRADILVTNDSGPMHIAAAVGTPVVAIFGSTDPSLCGPYGADHEVVKRELPCSCCYHIVCPIDHECMETISVDEVMGRVKNKLDAMDRSS